MSSRWLISLGLLLGSCDRGPAIFADTWIFDPTQNRWSEGPELPEAITGHTATLLPDGAVLLAGGDSPHEVGDVFRCDPTATSCTTIGKLLDYHDRADAALLDDGRVLLAGGQWNGSPELLDSGTGAAVLAPRNNLYETRVVPLSDGRVLAVGPYNDCAIFDPASDAWTRGPALSASRVAHAVVALADGSVLATGGYEDRRAVERLDPVTMTWSAMEPMLVGHAAHTVTLLADGRVLVVGGGASAEIYDPISNDWTAVADEPVSRTRHRSTLLNDGRVLITGGVLTVEGNDLHEPTWALYDPTTDVWEEGGTELPWRVYHDATLLSDGRVIVTGGDIGYLEGRLSD